jgi:hypothetical protein
VSRFMKISLWINFRIQIFGEKMKPQILCLKNSLFRKLWRLWDKVQIHGRGRQAANDNIIPRILLAWWIPRATITYPEWLTIIACPWQRRLHELSSMSRLCAYCLPCFCFEEDRTLIKPISFCYQFVPIAGPTEHSYTQCDVAN